MKTKIIVGFTLTLSLLATACGQLSPEKAAELGRQNNPNARIDTSTVKVATLNVNSPNPDVQYNAFLNVSTQVFTFVVTRANQATFNGIVTLSATDDSTLFNALAQLFTNQLALTTGNPCTVSSNATVTGINGSVNLFQCPQMIPAGTTANLMTSLNTFILNRLQPL